MNKLSVSLYSFCLPFLNYFCIIYGCYMLLYFNFSLAKIFLMPFLSKVDWSNPKLIITFVLICFFLYTDFKLNFIPWALVIIILSTQLSLEIISKLIRPQKERKGSAKKLNTWYSKTNSIDSLVTFDDST